MIRMYVLKKCNDTKERKQAVMASKDNVESLQDIGDGWRVDLKKTPRKKGIVLEDIPLKDYKKVKRCKQEDGEIKSSHKTNGTKEVKKQTTCVTLTTDSIDAIKDVIISEDDLDEDKTQRKFLIARKKPSIGDEDIEKTLVLIRKDEFRDLKVILSLLIALILGGALFLVLHYCFHYTIIVAGGISGGTTLVMCVAAGLSVHARCVVVLMSVGVFTGKGRAAFLCIITGILLTGPVVNIANNASEVATTLACITELAYNQSFALQRNLEMPLKEVEKQVQDMSVSVKREADVLGAELDVIKDGVVTVTDGLDQATNALQGASVACKTTLKGTFQQCESIVGNTRRRCREQLSKLDPGKAVKTLFGKLNPEGWFSRRKRDSTFPAEVTAGNHIRRKRGLEDVCNVFDVSDVCSGIKGADLCKSVTYADDVINEAIMDIVNQVNRIQEFFQFELMDTGVKGGLGNASKTTTQIVDSVHADTTVKMDLILSIVNVINKVMSMFFLVLILQAYWYKRHYLANITFDNVYISERMSDIDASRLEKKQDGVLPLRGNEKKTFINASSRRLLRSEITFRSLDIALVCMHMLAVVIVMFFDYVFYFILVMLKDHVQDHHSGDSDFSLYVVGSGPVTDIFKTFVKGFNSQQIYHNLIDIKGCLAKPNIPDQNTLFVLVCMYVVTFIICLLNPYGLRLRPKIAAFYFPEQETARVNYLHRLIEIKRNRYWIDLKHLISTYPNDGRLDSEIHWQSYDSNTTVRAKKIKLCCLQCQQKITKAWVCEVPSCQAVLCHNCYTDIGEQCPMCNLTKEYNEDVAR